MNFDFHADPALFCVSGKRHEISCMMDMRPAHFLLTCLDTLVIESKTCKIFLNRSIGEADLWQSVT